ncbi:MAG: hypothetical protein J5716_07125, partial [Alphaproteobacteria bacterium]|nr:hypothetical protein [Alphaproteobacteria bacterium]
MLWLTVMPAIAAVMPPPDLSVIQREKETQLVFSWKAPVNFTEETREGQYLLSFPVQVSGAVDSLNQIRAALPSQWRGINLTQSKKGLLFSVSLPENGSARALKKGKGRVILVSLSEAAPVLSETKTKTEPASPVSSQSPEKQIQKKQEPVEEIVPPPVSPEPLPEEKNDKQEKPSAREEVANRKESAQKSEAEQVDLSLIPYTETQTNISLTLSNPQSFDNKIEGYENMPTDNVSGYRAATLSFPWSRMTGVAAFRRDGYLWIVFDRQGDFDFSLERELYKDIIYEMIQIPHSHATIFRLVTAKGYNPSLRREGLLWIVDLMYQPMRARQPVDLILQRKTAFGPRIFIPLDESPYVLPLIDPEIGDLMYII